jgi:site-specific recombinase XerD
MSKDFQSLLSSFFLEYLPYRRSFSVNTTKGYRDAFVLIIGWLEDKCGIRADRISLADLTVSRIEAFLLWVCTERGCSEATSNIRLAALKSFARFVQTECPEHINTCAAILAIRAKKVGQPEIGYLSVDAVSAVLTSAHGDLRDHAMLALLYDSGARVAELCAVRICDIRFDPPCTVRLYGKGRKVRVVPISKQAARIVGTFIKKHHTEEDLETNLFLNNRGEAIGRAGVAYILKKHVKAANVAQPEGVPAKVHPHMLRHSKAMHMLEAGVNIIYIKDFLGHSSVTTTEVYAKANPEMKRKAIEDAGANIIKGTRYSAVNRKDLLNWLKKNI